MSNRPVHDCIKRDQPLVGEADDTVQQAAKRMAEARCSSILICDGDRLRGIFTERDLLVRVVAAGLDPSTTRLGQVMTADPDTIDGSAPVIEAIRRMDEFNYRHMPVLDAGRVVGRHLLARPAVRGPGRDAVRAGPAPHFGRAHVVGDGTRVRSAWNRCGASLLELPPKGGLHRKAPRGSLSAMALVGDHLFVGSDEGVVLDRVELLEPDRYGQAQGVSVARCPRSAEPNGRGRRDRHRRSGRRGSDCLWLVGSHSWTRGKPKDDPPRDLERVRSNPNRHVLACLPLLSADNGGPGPPVAKGAAGVARLRIGKKQGALPKSLRRDPHLGAFLKLPGKENGFDVEGIAVRAGRALLGLRGPVLRGVAIVLEIALTVAKPGRLKLQTVGAGGARYRKHFLDLGGNGIRDLHRDGDDLLILAGPTADLDGRCSIWRWREPWRQGADSFTVPGPSLERLLRIPVGDDDDHPEGFVVLPGGSGREVMVGYDAPAAGRKVGQGAVYADIFALPD